MSSHSVEAAQMASTQNDRRHKYSHSDERWSIGLALAATVLVPGYFLAVDVYSPQYVPVRAWVWAVPGIICILYLFAQFWALLHSAGRSDDIGMMDTVVSLLSALSCFGTLVAMVILSLLDKYHLGAFQAMTIITITIATFGELIFTAWVRYLVNRRYFASVGSQ
jgi:cation transport ATPase